jgi:hypothetical protein
LGQGFLVGNALVEANLRLGGLDQGGCKQMLSNRRVRRGKHVLEILDVGGLLEILQVAEIGDKVRLVEHFLHSQIVEIHGVCEALHKLGAASAKGD